MYSAVYRYGKVMQKAFQLQGLYLSSFTTCTCRSFYTTFSNETASMTLVVFVSMKLAIFKEYMLTSLSNTGRLTLTQMKLVRVNMEIDV